MTTQKWRILAIDDDPGTLEQITMALEDAYEVLTLSNPMEALDIAKMFEPDLILLDLMMPRVDGFHLLEILRLDRTLRDIPVTILSAKSSKRDIQYGYQMGVSLYLTKPFPPIRLRRNIDFFFENTPPPKRAKHINFAEVIERLKLLRCYKEGTIGFPSQILVEKGMLPREDKKSKPASPDKLPPKSSFSLNITGTQPKLSPEAEEQSPEDDTEETDRKWIG